MKKYLCLKNGDNFVTEDEEEAFLHLHKGHDHQVAEIEEDGAVEVRLLEWELPLDIETEEE
jgi:hypothetical protein